MGEKYFAQPSKPQSHFAEVPRAEIERSTFDRSHGHKTTFDAGQLVPIFVDEVLPGDTFDMSSNAFCRLATPLKPVMDNIYLDTHYFFVPYRLVWDNWQRFMGERLTPTDDPDAFRVPQTTVVLGECFPWKLINHMGLPQMAGKGPITISCLPMRAYVLIWNEWYRDQNLQSPQLLLTGNGPDTQWEEFGLLRRGKRHDYFTSCLPWPQKGDPVYIPLGTNAPVIPQVGAYPEISSVALGHTARNLTTATQSGGSANQIAYSGAGQVGGDQKMYWKSTAMIADLTTATAVTINDLRTAFQIQKLLERDARGGTRYIELLLSHFGVSSPDGRLQRPEYLGGGTTMLNINPIAQTVPLDDSPQANLAAIGTGLGRGHFNKSFTEHGIIIGMVSARADLTYQQGVERFWTRHTRYDFYWPALAHLGEQAVYAFEIYVDANASDAAIFGYQERYAEYRYKPSRITGLFSSEDQVSLDVWHLAQDFDVRPPLNFSFIEDKPPIDRIVAVPGEPHFLCDVWFTLKCTRPMPVYSVPGLIDHF